MADSSVRRPRRPVQRSPAGITRAADKADELNGILWVRGFHLNARQRETKGGMTWVPTILQETDPSVEPSCESPVMMARNSQKPLRGISHVSPDHASVRNRISAIPSRDWRVTAVAISAIFYALALALFIEPPHYQMFILGTVPILAASWTYGFKGAVISTVLLTLYHVSLILVKGGSPIEWLTLGGGGLGTLATLLVSSLIGQNSSLRSGLARERKELTQTQDVTIFALAYEAELRDPATGRHLERTSEYVRLLGDELARNPKYSDYLTKAYVSDLVRAAPLHDIGKVGTPDSILLKPGKLDPVEVSIMREHCELGAGVLKKANERLGFQSFLRIAIQLIVSHHEKWDGTGYPSQLEGERIPVSGRIMALADVYDALRSERPYKSAIEHARCCEIIRADRGTHFDPDVVDAFLRKHTDFQRVSTALGDSNLATNIEELKAAR
jgi:HD-GYP domain-containing protein (c-di-GMP phosphodiesterase class II)